MADGWARVLKWGDIDVGPMRWMLAGLALLFAGCLGSPASVFGAAANLDCSTNQAGVVSASSDVVFPATVPDDVKASFGPIPRVTVHAREGQRLQAVATWVPTTGDVGILYDGPRSNAVETDLSWTSYGEVSEGDYTLELQGTPMGFGVTYTLYLVATGCTPIVNGEA
ncbi:MAG: hypothetical protein QOC71_628 [Thermoplasmata archaeon]|jgi:hypothetical protein|nr:hypothetical protein [Thermoplasmata archaeon]